MYSQFLPHSINSTGSKDITKVEIFKFLMFVEKEKKTLWKPKNNTQKETCNYFHTQL